MQYCIKLAKFNFLIYRSTLSFTVGWHKLENILNDDLTFSNEVLTKASTQVVINPSGHTFLVNGADTLLDAALKSGLALNYGCSSGNCGLCKAQVVSGSVKKVRHHDYILNESERNKGYILMCSNTAISDLVVEAQVTARAGDIPVQEIETKVKSLLPLTDKVMQLQLQTPRSDRLRFFAGQNVNLSLPGMGSSDYAIASCPCDDRNLEFHIRNLPGDDFAAHVFSGLSRDDMVIAQGPIGNFVFDDESLRTPVFITCNSGFAPIKSLTMHAMALEIHEAIHLHWLGTHARAHYLSNLCRSWDDALDNFHYDEITATQLDETQIDHVMQHIVQFHPDLNRIDVYMTGPEIFVLQAKTWLLQSGLAESRISTAII